MRKNTGAAVDLHNQDIRSGGAASLHSSADTKSGTHWKRRLRSRRSEAAVVVFVLQKKKYIGQLAQFDYFIQSRPVIQFAYLLRSSQTTKRWICGEVSN